MDFRNCGRARYPPRTHRLEASRSRGSRKSPPKKAGAAPANVRGEKGGRFSGRGVPKVRHPKRRGGGLVPDPACGPGGTLRVLHSARKDGRAGQAQAGPDTEQGIALTRPYVLGGGCCLVLFSYQTLPDWAVSDLARLLTNPYSLRCVSSISAFPLWYSRRSL